MNPVRPRRGRRLRSIARQRLQPRSLSSGENHCDDSVVHGNLLVVSFLSQDWPVDRRHCTDCFEFRQTARTARDILRVFPPILLR